MNDDFEIDDNDVPVRVFEDDPNVYLSVYNMGWRWYYYNPDMPPLGEGAMGKVYLGYEYETNQKVAIKQLFDKYANSKAVRERASLEAALKFRHPNMVEMLGKCKYQDEDEDWHVWVVSNYVNGVTIDKHIRKLEEAEPNTDMVPKVCEYICSILEALDYLHSRGIIHRDIKPSNIMIEQGNTPKLMDLGIARVSGSNKYTSNGFVGTPLYASPEQILREKTQEEATPASDIYSLGMTLYVLINGSNPFNAETESKILTNQVTKKLPMSDKLKKYKKLMGVIWKATDKDKENRYQTAVEFRYSILDAMKPTTPDWMKILIYGGVALLTVIVLLLILL